MSVECPACGRRLRAQESLVGRRVKCPVCGNKFVIEHLSFGISQPSAAPSQVRGAASDRISRSERLVCSAKSSILPSLKISPDRKRTAYVAVERIGRFTANRLVIVDGIPGEPYEGIAVGSPIFSPDGKRLVYVAQTGSKWTIVLDGRQASSCDGVMKGEMLFSPNSARLGYIALSGKIFGFSPKARDYLRESHVWWGNVLRAKWYVTVDETRGDHDDPQ